MRPIEQIATDVFNGIIVNGEEQLAFVAKYGDGTAASYGVATPEPEQDQQDQAPPVETPKKKQKEQK